MTRPRFPWYAAFEVDGGGSVLDSDRDQAPAPPVRTGEPPTGGSSLRILFIAPYVPSPLRPRPFHFIRALAEAGHRVSLVATATTDRELADGDAIGRYCHSLRLVRVSLVRSLWNCLAGLAGTPPLQARFCWDPAMSQAIGAAAAGQAHDVLHVEHLRAALFGLAEPRLPRVYDAVDCMSRLQEHTAQAGPTIANRLIARAELSRTRAFERNLMARFERVLVSADSERQALLALAGDRPEHPIRVVANGVDTTYFAPRDTPREPATLVFVGRMGYHANFAAARHLIAELLPRLWQRRPQLRLLIVGDGPSPALRGLAEQAGARVEVTGYVDDVRPYLARATVAVNPLTYAVGIQNKVLEAMAMATPVVATAAACGGLSAIDGEHLLIAAHGDRLAAAVERLLDDPALAARLGASGRAYVLAHHDWRAAAHSLVSTYGEAIAARARHRAQMGVA